MAELKFNIDAMTEGFIKAAKDRGLFVSRWIPVSERLPEKNVEVLITTIWDEVTIGEMFSNNDWFIREGATNVDIDDVKAWMPLPSPWKGEQDENSD